jgi:hypothetical protein
MGDLPSQLITSLPVAVALIYVIKMFLSAQKEWREDLKSTSQTSNEVIERCTDALMRIENVISKCSIRQEERRETATRN